jgi:hypothetical protein
MRRLSTIALGVALATGFVHAQQATPSADAPQLTRELIAKGITPPKLLNKVKAEYPDEARRKHIHEGLCVVSLLVNVSGVPEDIKLVRSSDPSFIANSFEVVKQYRFKPATTQERAPVAVRLLVEIHYWSTVGDGHEWGKKISFEFSSPPGTLSSRPGADGVYPLTKIVAPPVITKFSDKEYRSTTFLTDGNGACDIVLTISEKGKPSDPQVIHCQKTLLEKPAVESLLKSKFKPGMVDGKAVPVRASIHLEIIGNLPK